MNSCTPDSTMPAWACRCSRKDRSYSSESSQPSLSAPPPVAMSFIDSAPSSPPDASPAMRSGQSLTLSWWKTSPFKSMSSGRSISPMPAPISSSLPMGSPSEGGAAGASNTASTPPSWISPPPSSPPSSSSGLRSSSSPMNASISIFDSASSRIACCNCGVITSDWLCLRSRRGPSAIGSASCPPACHYKAKPSPRYRRRTFSSATSASGVPANSTLPS